MAGADPKPQDTTTTTGWFDSLWSSWKGATAPEAPAIPSENTTTKAPAMFPILPVSDLTGDKDTLEATMPVKTNVPEAAPAAKTDTQFPWVEATTEKEPKAVVVPDKLAPNWDVIKREKDALVRENSRLLRELNHVRTMFQQYKEKHESHKLAILKAKARSEHTVEELSVKTSHQERELKRLQDKLLQAMKKKQQKAKDSE